MNYFNFDKTFYQQISGTSMGTICTPNYANLYMGWEHYKKYYRFFDNIFCIFQGNEQQNDFS